MPPSFSGPIGCPPTEPPPPAVVPVEFARADASTPSKKPRHAFEEAHAIASAMEMPSRLSDF